MYSRTGKLTAKEGKREQLIGILLRASTRSSNLRGCRAYLVFEDIADENSVVVFEIWDNQDAHASSLGDADVRALIAEAMPILAGTPTGSEMILRGGHGLETKGR